MQPDSHALSPSPTLADAPKPPQTARGTKRRAALLDAADRLFLEKGYDQVSLDDLVAEVGGSKAAIYQYFGSKQGLLLALVEFRCERFVSQNDLPQHLGEHHLRDVLIRTLRSLFQAFTQPDHAAFMRLIVQESQRDPLMAERFNAVGPLRGLHTTQSLLKQAEQQGQIRCPYPLESALLFLSTLQNIKLRVLMGLSPLEEGLIPEVFFERTVDLFLAAHRP